MKEKVGWIISFMLVLVLSDSSVTHARVWTDCNGKQIEAEFIEVSKVNPRKVILLFPNGKKASFTITYFSKRDQVFIRAQESVRADTGKQNSEEELYESTLAVVTAEGYGENVGDAKQDAIQSAIHQVVGTLVDSEARVENDEIVENILTASNAYVERYKVLETDVKDGIWHVRIKAYVARTAITETLKRDSKSSSLKVDGSSILGKKESKEKSEIDGVLFLANFLKKEQFPYSLIDVEFIGEPKIEASGNQYTYTCKWRYKVNLDRYYIFVDRLLPILDELAIQDGTFVTRLTWDKYGISYPCMEPKDDNQTDFFLPVCTHINGNYQSMRWRIYRFPPKYLMLMLLYRSVAPCLDISLLDKDGNRVKSSAQIVGYGRKNDDYDYFNLFPDLILSTRGAKEKDVAIQSVISRELFAQNLKANYFMYSIAPMCTSDERKYYDKIKVFVTLTGTTRFTLTPSELSRVKSTSASIVAENPMMEKAYKKLSVNLKLLPTL